MHMLSVISATLLDLYLFQDLFNLLLILDMRLWRKSIVCVFSALSLCFFVFFFPSTLAQLSVTTFVGVEKEDFFFCNKKQTGPRQSYHKDID